MKTKILFLCMALCALAAQADDYDYPYLRLTAADGSQTVLPVDGLEITFSDGELVAVTSGGTQRLQLAALASMAFTDEALLTGVAAPAKAAAAVSVYALSGLRLGSYESLDAARKALPQGVYVVKAGRETSKIVVR